MASTLAMQNIKTKEFETSLKAWADAILNFGFCKNEERFGLYMHGLERVAISSAV